MHVKTFENSSFYIPGIVRPIELKFAVSLRGFVFDIILVEIFSSVEIS